MPITATKIVVIKGFNFALMLTLFLLDAVVALDLNWRLVLVALFGSMSGAFVLGYFKQASRFWERMVKMLSSAIAGLFIGAFFSRYFALEFIEYIGMMYFISSFVSLVFLKAILSLSENNAKDIIIRIFTSVFTATPRTDETPREKRRRQKGQGNPARLEVTEVTVSPDEGSVSVENHKTED